MQRKKRRKESRSEIHTHTCSLNLKSSYGLFQVKKAVSFLSQKGLLLLTQKSRFSLQSGTNCSTFQETASLRTFAPIDSAHPFFYYYANLLT